MKRSAIWSAVFLLAAATVACGGAEETAEPAAEPAPASEAELTGGGVAGEDESVAEPTGESGTLPLLDPNHPDANRQAPDRYRVAFDTTKGRIVVELHREWAPLGADRFYNLVRAGYYDGNRFFRVLDGFIAQFGMNGDPAVNEAWDTAAIPDDPMGEMNTRGRLTFAHGGPDTRTTQLFINLGDNLNLDNAGFPPFGEVIEGMGVIDSLYSAYGEGAPDGAGPSQGRIGAEGTPYLEREFPLLDYVEAAVVIAER